MTKLEDILVLGIETVSAAGSLDEVPPALQRHWVRKAGSIKNEKALSAEDLYFDRAAIYSEFGKVLAMAIGIFRKEKDRWCLRIKSFANEDEQELLRQFTLFLNSKFNPERLTLCAHNGKEFDFPYLCRRMLLNGIKIPYALDLSGKKPWEVHHVDTMEMWKFGDRKSFTSLELLTEIFGIESSNSDMDGSLINRVYYEENGMDRIAEYCCHIVADTAQLYLKMNALPAISPQFITIV